MSIDNELANEGTLSRIFRYFGFPQSTFLVFSGIIVSGLGFQDIINPAFWTAASLFALILGYSLRNYVPAHYAAVAAFIALAYLGALAFALSPQGKALLAAHWPNDDLTASVVRFAILMAVVFLFVIGLISHRKHSEKLILDLPDKILTAVRSGILEGPFYYQSFNVDAQIERSEDDMPLRADLTITNTIVNRTSQAQKYSHIYSKSTANSQLRQIKVNDTLRDILDPNVHTENSVRLVDEIAPNGTLTVEIKLSDRLSRMGQQIFTCYGMPAENFSFSANNVDADNIKIWLDVLSSDISGPVRNEGTLTWKSTKGLLPNQGIRLNWSI